MTLARSLTLCLLALGLAACGDDGENAPAQQEQPEAAGAAAGAAVPAVPSVAIENPEGWVARQAAFLEGYAAQEGVARSPGGVLYRVLEEGEGEKPILGEVVRVHYEGSLIDGTVFDSSYARQVPAEFPSDGLIEGWREILPMMREGDKWEIAIPAELAYAGRGAGNVIPPNSALVFTLELIEVKK